MKDELDTLLREHAEEIAALPSDDPLRRALARSGRVGEQQAELDAEAELLRRELLRLDVPPIEAALLSLPRRPMRRIAISATAVAAALVLAFVLGQRFSQQREETVAPTMAIAEPRNDAATRDAPKLIAVKFWHVTCPACKELDPRYAEVVASFDESEVLFVTLDMSTTMSRQQSALLASALGIRDVYDEVFGSSGFVVLFDATSKKRLGKLTATQPGDEMKSSIRDALSRARS